MMTPNFIRVLSLQGLSSLAWRGRRDVESSIRILDANRTMRMIEFREKLTRSCKWKAGLGGWKRRAREDEMEAQRVRAPKLWRSVLQKALRPEPHNRVDYWQCLPPEYPTGHRKADCRITQMHHSHTPPSPARFVHHQGRNYKRLYRHNSNGHEEGTGHNSAIGVARK